MINLFRRVSDLLEANCNALLDRVENPEAMLTQILGEMESGVAEARRSAAAAIASERRLARELEQQRSEVERWTTRAREALAANREDLARQALVRKIEHQDLVRALEDQVTAALQTSTNVKTALRVFEARLAEARQRQRSLLARHRAARARQELHRFAVVGTTLPGSPPLRFERLEDRLTQLEDELQAHEELQQIPGGLERELADLEAGRAIDAELEALKRDVGGGR